MDKTTETQENKVFKSCDKSGIIILELQHNDASFQICMPTNRIAYFVEVSLF